MIKESILKKTLLIFSLVFIGNKITAQDGLEFEKKVKTEKVIVYNNRIPLDIKEGFLYAIVDPIPIESKLNILTTETVELGTKEIEFYVYTNYSENIKKWELSIYNHDERSNSIKEVVKLKGDELKLNQPLKVKTDFFNRKKGQIYSYELRVYNAIGDEDTTARKTFTLTDEKNLKKSLDISEIVYGTDDTVSKNILVNGSRVRVYGKHLSKIKKVNIDSQEIKLDENENFIYESYFIGEGKRIIDLELIDSNEQSQNYKMSVDLSKSYNYLIGIADLFIGRNYISGNENILLNDPDYNGSLFNRGRLAFYYKGLHDGYRITSQADTWDNEIKDIFNGFSKRDSRNLFQKLERDDIEFNMGDDSNYYYDVNSEGKFYLKVEKDKSEILWGSFNTGFTGSENIDYNRGLYGLRAEYNSLTGNGIGESKYHLKGFVSNPDTMYSRDEFLGTGGSVYYLRTQDIVTGSAKVTIQVKEPRTGRIVREIALQEYKDYEINELQGRIILKNPLPTIVSSSQSEEIIKEQPFYGENIVLAVDYEYYSSKTDISKMTYGLRGKTWLNENLAIGGTYVSEERGEGYQDYELQGVDITLNKSEDSFLRLEIGKSKGVQTYNNNFSFNGGYEFFQNSFSESLEKKSGNIYAIDGSLYLKDFIETDKNINMDFWYKEKDKGFSTANMQAGSEIKNYGFSSYQDLGKSWFSRIGADRYEERKIGSKLLEERADFILGYELDDKITISTELEYIKNNEISLIGENKKEEALMLGGKVNYEFDPAKNVYVKAQTDIIDDNYGANNLYSLGTNIQVNEKLNLNAEGSTGNRGEALDLNLRYDLNERHSLYTGYNFESEGNSLTFGQRFKQSEKLSMYQENQFVDDDYGKGILQGYGIDYDYSDRHNLGVMIQHGNIDTNEGNLKRTTTSAFSRYYGKTFMTRNKLEYSKDKGYGQKADSWATINRMKKIINEEYTLFGEGNYIYRDNRNEKNSRSLELGVGLAYRPIWNDRLNFIGRYNYLENIGMDYQLNSANDEKAHVVSLESIYEINQRWDIGFKYAFRKENLRDGIGQGRWYESELDLYAIRLNYEFIKKWNAYGEYHLLRDIESKANEHGAVLAVYREIGDNLKIGGGYNFTKFDDDLTDLDYNAKGWFINIIGKI